MTDAKEDPRTPYAGKDSNKPGIDSGMTEKEKDRMFNQMEQFEGPERREVRGDECEPEKDPGVSHS
jgi:hypothetical protein